MPREKGTEEGRKPPAWLSSYGDMITNLMTFFVLLVTFSSKSEGEFRQFKSGLFSGPLAGLGLLNPASAPEDNFRSELLERSAAQEAMTPNAGSRMPPRYQEELVESATVLKSLLASAHRDSRVGAITLRLPASALAREGRLTPAAENLLSALATVFHRFPYDIQFLAGSPAETGLAALLARDLSVRMGENAWVSAGIYPTGDLKGTIVLAINMGLGRLLDANARPAE